MERGMVVAHAQRLAIRLLCLRMPPLPTQAEGKVGARAHVRGVDTDGLAQRRFGVRMAALAAEGDAKLEPEITVVRPQRSRAAKGRLRLGVLREGAEGEPTP